MTETNDMYLLRNRKIVVITAANDPYIPLTVIHIWSHRIRADIHMSLDCPVARKFFIGA